MTLIRIRKIGPKIKAKTSGRQESRVRCLGRSPDRQVSGHFSGCPARRQGQMAAALADSACYPVVPNSSQPASAASPNTITTGARLLSARPSAPTMIATPRHSVTVL